jgi:hypothetical protein
MKIAVVDGLQVSSINPTVTVAIEFQEGLVSDGLSFGIKFALQYMINEYLPYPDAD